jgi:uncharacterized protein (DUF1499 family)
MSLPAKIFFVFLALALAALLSFYVRSGLSRLRPPRVGLTPEGNLLPCSPRPNCVSSQAPDREHQTRPFPYSGSRQETQAKLRAAIATLPRLRFVKEEDRYWHLTAVSRLFRYTDDVEFLFDDEARLVHVRSASRIGVSDMGANRTRVRALRAAYEG